MNSSLNLITKDDKIFIAGHNGMVGSAILRALKRSGYKNLLTLSRSDLNLIFYQDVKSWFEKINPRLLFLQRRKLVVFPMILFPADFLLNNLKIQNNAY